jgi:hypothetical protein
MKDMGDAIGYGKDGKAAVGADSGSMTILS